MSESKAPKIVYAHPSRKWYDDNDTVEVTHFLKCVAYRRGDLSWLPVSPNEAADWIINEMGKQYAALLLDALEYRL